LPGNEKELNGLEISLRNDNARCPKCGEPLGDGTGVCESCGEAAGGDFAGSGSEATGAAPPAAHRATLYAGFWLRAVAFLIDFTLLAIFTGVAILGPLISRGAIPADNPGFLRTAPAKQVLAIQLLFDMAYWLYFASFESSLWQATPGKRAVGLIVTDLKGQRITFARASGRFLGRLLSQIPLFLGYVLAGFTAKKQALHDLLASTLVLKKPSQI
jgi:uncharacterized RDD family membrane protein YckC